MRHFGSVLLLFTEPPHLFAFVALTGFSFVLRTKTAHMGRFLLRRLLADLGKAVNSNLLSMLLCGEKSDKMY